MSERGKSPGFLDGDLRGPPNLDVQKSIELGFDTAKQLTTLSAGSSVLLATFLKDIFSNAEGNLAINAFETSLIGISFFCLGFTLLLSISAMWGFAIMRRMRAGFKRQVALFGVYSTVCTLVFVSGIGTFVWAVLSDLQP